MSDRDKGPIDHVADLFVFAPLGFVLEARHMWPDFVRSGRKWCGARIGAAQDQADAALHGLGLVSGPNGSKADERVSTTYRAPVEARTGRAASGPRAVPAAPPVDVELLAVPDYDALSASQVVPRLAGLAPDELELVRRYEAGTRGRKTILNKIAQLQSG